MKKRGSSLARRKLSFIEKPFSDRTFYIDIRSENVKSKVARRIQELGGCIEGFLTKEVHLLITDKNKNDIQLEKTFKKEKEDLSPSGSQNSLTVPLSRGKALLLKATQQKNIRQNNGTKSGNDIIQNASLLGVKVEQVSIFLKESRKLLLQLKQVAGDEEVKCEAIEGISPLSWKEPNKENRNIIKIEDSSLNYKPMLKHLDDFPCIRYSDQLISPFDKAVTLCKKSVSKPHRYSTKTKQKVLVHKGGFCEACDYWYKCSLREHLNSEKHQKFVRDSKNFDNLDEIISKMPSLNDFIGKFLPRKNIMKSESSSQSFITGEIECNMVENVTEKTSCDLTVNSDLLQNDMDIVVDSKVENDDIIQDEEIKMDIDAISVISKESLSEDSMDSGTGPELVDGVSRNSIAYLDMSDVTSREAKNNFKPSDSDSALPPDLDLVDNNIDNQDVVMQSCSTNLCGQDSSCDNAMFICISNGQDNNMPIDQATTNIRKRILSISIQGSTGEERENINTDSEKLQQGFHNLFPNPNSDRDCKTPILCDKNNQSKTSAFMIKDTMDNCDMPTTERLKNEDLTSQKNFQVNYLEMPLLENVNKTIVYSCVDDLQEKQCVQHLSESFDPDMPVLNKFEFSPQKTDLSNKNESFVDIASHWMKDICGQDSVKKQDSNVLPATINFSKESNFILNSEIKSSSLKSSKDMADQIAADNVSMDERNPLTPNKEKIVVKPVYVNTAAYSDISAPDMSENIFPNIENPFSFQNQDICSRSSSRSLSTADCAQVISGSDFDSTSTHSIQLESQTPKTPSSFFRPWISELESPGNNSKSERKRIKIKINLSAADMGSLLKEVKLSTCKKKKVKGKRKTLEQNMNDNKNNKTVYSCQQNGTKLKLCKVSSTPVPQQNNLHTYWKVRKSSDCRLVFSANKRKMEETSSYQSLDDNAPIHKRRRCLAF